MIYELDVYMREQAGIDSALRKINLIYFHPAARVYKGTVDAIYSNGQSKGLRAALSVSVFLFLSLTGTRWRFFQFPEWKAKLSHVVSSPGTLSFFFSFFLRQSVALKNERSLGSEQIEFGKKSSSSLIFQPSYFEQDHSFSSLRGFVEIIDKIGCKISLSVICQ